MASAFGEVDIGPAGESILPIPDTFAVAQQNECVHWLERPPEGGPLRPRRNIQRSDGGAAGIHRLRSELFLDAKELVVLADTIRSAGRPGLDLSRGRADRQVGDGCVLGFT